MKFSGKIGFWIQDKKVKPGIYKPEIVEKSYTGDILANSRRFQSSENQQNENLKITGRISIISDLYIKENWPSIKYVLWNNVKWSVISVDIISYPRVIIELGGVYNGNNTST